AIECGPIRSVAGIQVAYRLFAIDHRGDGAGPVVSRWIVAQRPVMDICPCGKTFEPRAPRRRITNQRKPSRAVSARAPVTRRVFDERIKYISTALQPEGDAVRCAPLVNGIGVEEPDEHMKTLVQTHYLAGCGQE